MSYDIAQINELIKNRRAIFPKTYNDRPIPTEIIQQILENANWAPTHRFTEPWRFKVFRGEGLRRLGAHLAELYKAKVDPDKYSEMKYNKTKNKPLRSACVIAICMQRDPEESVPEWEELAAVACAVQNMWLSCTAYGIGSYWSSPATISDMNEFLELGQGERCLGFFFMGYHDLPQIPGKRKSIEDKVVWIEE